MSEESGGAFTERELICDGSLVISAISRVMAEAGSVGKAGVNKDQGYKFVSIADIAERLQGLMAKHGLVLLQTEVERTMIDEVMCITYEFIPMHISGDEGPILRQSGLAKFRFKNGSADDKAANKCHTAARKYCLIALFQIPTVDIVDADAGDAEHDTKIPAGGARAGAKIGADVIVPKPTSLPVDLKPYLIPIVDLDWKMWGMNFAAAIRGAKSADEINAWIDCNTSCLGELAVEATLLHKRIVDIVKEETAKYATPNMALNDLFGKFAMVKTRRALQNIFANEVNNSGYDDKTMELIVAEYDKHEKRLGG